MRALPPISLTGPPQVVWFKRDLRVEDHTALSRATAAGPVLCVYSVELDHWHQPCTSDRQWQFVRECLLSLDVQLSQTVMLLPTVIKTDPLPCAGRQRGGLQPARDLLESFLDSRGQGYGANMSSPATAEHGCSRLSPHIAHGSLSLRQIAQTTLQAREDAPRTHWHRHLHSYVTRL